MKVHSRHGPDLHQNLSAPAFALTPASGYAGMTRVAVIGRQEIPLCGRTAGTRGRAIAHSHSREEKQ